MNTGKRSAGLTDRRYAVLLVLPAVLVTLFFGLFPLGYAINLSLHEVDLMASESDWAFVGLDNFRFALADDVFGEALWRTVRFAMISVTAQMVIGVWLAFMLNGLKWFKGAVRALFILPMASAPAAVGMIWRYLYDSEFGVFNSALTAAGLPPVNWLGDANVAFWSIVVFDVWQWTPFVMLIILAALQSLPREPFEAAALDGGSKFRVLTRLTFPMLTPILVLVFLLRFIDAFRLYDPIATTTRGGPGQTTETITFLLYRIGLKQFRMDVASAMSLIILFIIIIVTSFILRRLLRNQADRARVE